MSEFMTALTSDPASLFGMLFNLLIVIALGGLWLMWARHVKRQKNVEAILAATSGQLEEATRHLESALLQIQRLQEEEDPRQTAGRHAGDATPSAPLYAYRQAQASPAEPDTQPQAASSPQATSQAAKAPHIDPAPQPGDRSRAPASDEPSDPATPDSNGQTDVQQIIRLHDLGRPAEQIAEQTGLPLARVNLLLHLHEQRANRQDLG